MPTQPHPAILNAHELDPGHWHMHAGGDRHEHPYACIRLLDVGTATGPRRVYRAVTWAPSSTDRRLIGYYPRLEVATDQARRQRAAEVARGAGPDGAPAAYTTRMPEWRHHPMVG